MFRVERANLLGETERMVGGKKDWLDIFHWFNSGAQWLRLPWWIVHLLWFLLILGRMCYAAAAAADVTWVIKSDILKIFLHDLSYKCAVGYMCHTHRLIVQVTEVSFEKEQIHHFESSNPNHSNVREIGNCSYIIKKKQLRSSATYRNPTNTGWDNQRLDSALAPRPAWESQMRGRPRLRPRLDWRNSPGARCPHLPQGKPAPHSVWEPASGSGSRAPRESAVS